MKPDRPRILGLGALSWGIIAAALIATVEGYRALEWKYAHKIIDTREEAHPAASRYMDRVEAELSEPDPNRPDWAGRYSGQGEALVLAPTSGYISFYAADIGEFGFQFGRVRENDGRLRLYNRGQSDFLIVRRDGDIALIDANDSGRCLVRDKERDHWQEEQARRRKLCPTPRRRTVGVKQSLAPGPVEFGDNSPAR